MTATAHATARLDPRTPVRQPGTPVLHPHGLPRPGRTLVMGVVNVTPDSFSDGGLAFATDAAVAHGLALLEEGADVVAVDGESTLPQTPSGGTPISLRPARHVRRSRRSCDASCPSSGNSPRRARS